MARLITSGAELGTLNTTAEAASGPDGQTSSNTTTSIITGSDVRSGVNAWRFIPSVSGQKPGILWTIAGALDVYYFARLYILIRTGDPAPTLSSDILGFSSTTSRIGGLTLTPSRTLQLSYGAASQAGGGSEVLSLDVYHRIDLAIKTGTGAVDEVYGRLDGVEFASAVNLSITDESVINVRIGWALSTGDATAVLTADDFAVNDGTGADQNSYPTEGKIVLLKPISDNARGSWTGGAGGTANLFDAIDNTPPIGTAAETDLTQIENTISGATAPNGDFNCTSYTTAGISSDDVVTVVQAVANHGEDIATGTKTGTIAVASNPVGSASASFNFGDDIGALGTFPTNWRWVKGPVSYNPTVVKGTSPVVRITKTDTGTRVASCDFLGIYCEYVPHKAISPYVHSEAKNRASTW